MRVKSIYWGAYPPFRVIKATISTNIFRPIFAKLLDSKLKSVFESSFDFLQPGYALIVD